jgi:PAS domain-containing protein
MAEKDIYKLIIDSISTHVAVLDKCGEILETNQAWQQFAATNNLDSPMHCAGMNYLAVCEQAIGDSANEAGNIADRIRRVIDGEQDEYFTQYSCHSPEEKRWFALRVVRIKNGGRAKAIVTHENITPIMAAQEKLEETNVALKVLLKQMDK